MPGFGIVDNPVLDMGAGSGAWARLRVRVCWGFFCDFIAFFLARAFFSRNFALSSEERGIVGTSIRDDCGFWRDFCGWGAFEFSRYLSNGRSSPYSKQSQSHVE